MKPETKAQMFEFLDKFTPLVRWLIMGVLAYAVLLGDQRYVRRAEAEEYRKLIEIVRKEDMAAINGKLQDMQSRQEVQKDAYVGMDKQLAVLQAQAARQEELLREIKQLIQKH